MKCPNCGGKLQLKVDDSRELLLMCENASYRAEDCHYAVGLHEIPVVENELQALIDTAPQFLLSKNISRQKDSL